MASTVSCPHCRHAVPWGPESPYRPFCSERCRLLDLGEWLTGGHLIPEPLEDAASAHDAGDWAAEPLDGHSEGSDR